MSFWIYPIIFLISCGLINLSDKLKKQQRFCIVLVALLMPSILSGCRDYSMGYDVELYGNRYFELAHQYNFIDYIQLMTDKQIEPLYAILNKLVSYVSDSPHLLYGIQTFIILILIYLMVKECNYSTATCFMAFFCIMFIDSFNILRQYLAIAIIFFSFKFVRKKKFIKYIICIAISTGFHFTGISGLILWPLYSWITMFNKSNPKKIKNISSKSKRKIILITLLAVLLVIQFGRVTSTLVGIGFFPVRYVAYDTGIDTTLNISGIVSRLPLLILAFIIFKHRKEKNREAYFFLTMLILEIIFVQLRTLGVVFLRITYIFIIFKILLIGNLCNTNSTISIVKRKVYKLNIYSAFVYLYTIAYFVLVYFVISNEGYYLSTLLGIR